jgi:acyl carrier protein
MRKKSAQSAHQEPLLNLLPHVLPILDSVLGLHGRSAGFRLDTPLLGAVPELDSMAVVALISALEDQFAVAIDDEDLEATTFATVGSLCAMLSRKQAA